MEELVSISADRLIELELLEASIPSMIEKAVTEYKKSNLKKLHERDKANPEAINLRVKRYVERHRDEINKRRREKRQKEKQQKYADTAGKLDIENQLILNDLNEIDGSVKVQSIFVRAANKAISKSDIPIVRKQARLEHEEPAQAPAPDRMSNVTVRFDM
jgi:hypothetical protein